MLSESNLGGTVAASAKLSSDVLIIDCILSYWASAVANGLDLIRNFKQIGIFKQRDQQKCYVNRNFMWLQIWPFAKS